MTIVKLLIKKEPATVASQLRCRQFISINIAEKLFFNVQYVYMTHAK